MPTGVGFAEKDIKVGIISRGYGRKSKTVHVLNTASSVADAGDEPLLLFRQTGAPTAVAAAVQKQAGIVAAHPELELIVADDGLQHYALLQRDMEIAVFPAADTGRTNLDLLPNGSLRTFVSVGFR